MRPPTPEPAKLSKSEKLRAEDLDYFDFDYENEHNEFIISVGRYIYYRDIFVWIDHFKDLVKNHSEEELRSIITQIFRDSALIWYFTELSELEKDLLRKTFIDRWYQALTRRFKQKRSKIQKVLDSCFYTLQDAKNGRTPRIYIQNIIRYVKVTQLSLYNQLLLAYIKIYYKFHIHLTEFIASTILSSFLDQLDFKINAFYDIAKNELRGSRSSNQ